MYRDILVPTDGGETTETVLEHTITVANDHDATVHVLYVVDDGALLTLAEQMKTDVLENLKEDGERALEQATETLDTAGLEVVTELREGKPANEILSYVDEQDIDLVTMGTHGDEYTKNMLGSTSQEVVTDSSAPVLTVNVTDE